MSISAGSLLRDKYIPDTTSSWIRPAGVTTHIVETAKDALSWSQPPPTPGEQKKYRQSTVHEPGRTVRHFGTADDPVPSGPFGVQTRSGVGEDIASYLKNHPESELGRWQQERSEACYASNTREPLGRTYQRGHKMPEGMGTEVPFGCVYNGKELERMGQVRSVIFPTDADPNTASDGHELYLKSHGAFGPGEQRHRNYNWAASGVDPAAHRFGAVDKDDVRDGVRKALQPGLDQSAPQPAKLAAKIHQDFKATQADLLGQTKKLGGGDRPNLLAGHTYGLHSLRHGPEPGVDQLIQGAYTAEQQAPDADLGKSLREGWRNVAPEGRTFGVPSIRTDVPKPRAAGVANTRNYGNEPDALQLLRPPKSVELGVGEEAYMAMRSRDEVRTLVADAALQLSDEEFERCWGMAAGADGEGPDRACLDTFFRARHHVLSQTLEVAVPF